MTTKKLKSYFIILITMLSFASCSQTKIEISHDFDHGSIGQLKEVSSGNFVGTTEHWLKRDGIGDQYYWFYFKAEGVKNKEVSFELNDLVGVYRGTPHLVYTDYTQPVYSYDQKHWKRIPDVAYDSASHTFSFKHRFTEEAVWIAYAHPYTYERVQMFKQSISGHPDLQIENIATSPEGRPIDLLTITDPGTPDNKKRTIVLIGLQHAGEDAGAYLLEGLVEFLLSKDPRALEARQKFIYKVVPMMNPDGIFNGTSRYNKNMEDLNNIWLNDSLMQPEVSGVIKWREAWYNDGNKIDLFFDVHNHSQFHTQNVCILLEEQLDSLILSMDSYWPIIIHHSTFKGSADGYFHSQNIPSGTIELSQSYVEEGKYLTIDDYHGYGKGTVLGITDFFDRF